MSNQDYISRSPNKKKNNPYKKKPRKESPAVTLKTKFITLLLVLLVAGFSYGLWALKNNPATKSPIEEKLSSSQLAKTNEANLPKPPEEKWTYVDNLKTKEVEVGEYTVTERGPYKMQCGSFRKKSQAESVKAKMAFIGIESKIQQAQGKTSLWYKVILGPYERKRMAEKDKHKLKNNKITDCQIWLWK